MLTQLQTLTQIEAFDFYKVVNEAIEISKYTEGAFDVTIFDLREPLNHGLKFLKGSINEINDVTNAIHGFDIVIHLAASLGVINTEENPVSTLDTNIFGTRNVLEACKVNKIKKIIFSSSSEIYGEPIKTPIEEKDRPIPITMYGISKLAAEEYIKSYSKNFGLKYTIFRLFNYFLYFSLICNNSIKHLFYP